MQLNFHLTTSQVFTIFHSRIFCIPAFFYYYYNKHLFIKQRKIDRVNDPYFGQFPFLIYKNIHIYFSFQLKKKKTSIIFNKFLFFLERFLFTEIAIILSFILNNFPIREQRMDYIGWNVTENHYANTISTRFYDWY